MEAQNDTNFIQIKNAFYQGYNYQIDTNEGSALNQFQRLDSRLGQKFGSTGSIINAGSAINAWVQGYNSGGRASSSIVANWEEIGPKKKPQGLYASGTGRLNCITLHPNYNGTTNQTIFVGSPFGGVWKTVDDGQNWTNLNTDFQLPIIKVSDIAIDPSNPNMIFIATGDRDNYHFDSQSAGVYRSSDGGQSWLPINSGLSFSGFFQISKILINPSNVDEAYLATEKGIYKTTNATTSCQWSLLTHSLVNNKYFRNIIYKPNGLNSTLYASGKDILKSTDGGNTWSSLTGSGTGLDFSTLTNGSQSVPYPVRINIDVSPADPNYIYANIVSSNHSGQLIWNSIRADFIYRYDGTSWQQKASIPNGSVYVGDVNESWIPIAVSPSNIDHFYTGNVIVWRSLNGGSTSLTQAFSYYAGIVHPDIHDVKYSPDGQSLFIACDGGCYKLTNPTYSTSPNWITLDNGLGIGTITKIGGAKLNPALMLIGEIDCGSNLFNPSSLGSSNPWKLTKAGDGAEQIIDFDNNQIMFSSVQKQAFARSDDGGSSFITQQKPSGEDSEFMADYIMHPRNPNVLYFNFTELYKRTYSGNTGTWLKVSNFKTDYSIYGDLLTAVAISEKKTTHIYASIYAYDQNWNPSYRIFKSSSGGYDNSCTNNCWSELYPPSPHYITSIAVSFQDENKIWVSYSGYDALHKIKKFDGLNWLDESSGLPNVPINNIILEKGTNDGIYAATDIGVYYKNAEMSQWQPFMDNLPNVQVNELEINYSNNKIRAGTFGRGLWESSLACPQSGSIALSGNVTQNKFIERGGSITSTESLNSGLNVKYRSTESVELLPGFIVTGTTNSDFEAFIHGCDTPGNSFRQMNFDDNSEEIVANLPIKEIEKLNNSYISVIPNPNNGNFHMLIVDDGNTVIKEVKLFNILGKKIWESDNLLGRSFEINISNEPNGVYYLQAIDVLGNIHKEKVLKQ